MKRDMNGNDFFVKQFEEASICKKVITIHQQLEKIQFPYSQPLTYFSNQKIMQRWLKGYQPAEFSLEKDRRLTFEALCSLHRTNEQIDWHQFGEIPKNSLKEKWKSRIKKFKQQKRALISLLGNDDYETILELAIKTHKQLKDFDDEYVTLCHGDVAHHNFLHKDNDIKIIDFDLAYLGDPTEELILWVLRILPFIDYDIMKLFEELPGLRKIQNKITYLSFPNELMRESLFLVKLPIAKRGQFQQFFEPFKDQAIKNRGKLSQQIEQLRI